MAYAIKKDGARALYLSLYDRLRADIVSGVYPYGARLPSKRALAAETGTSLVTVEHALSLLTDEKAVRAAGITSPTRRGLCSTRRRGSSRRRCRPRGTRRTAAAFRFR